MGSCRKCTKETSTQCSGCKIVYYCSKECQKSSWKKHKVDCDIMKQANRTLTYLKDDVKFARETFEQEMLNHDVVAI